MNGISINLQTLHVLITADAPVGEENPELWRRADIVLLGEPRATGFAKGTRAELSNPNTTRAVEGEAVTLAWHKFTKEVSIIGATEVTRHPNLVKEILSNFRDALKERKTA